MKELLKEEISGVFTNEDNTILVFAINYAGCHAYIASGDCCSSTWYESINNLEFLIGERVIGIELKEFPALTKEEEKPNYDVITRYGYTLKTEKGYIDIEYRNSSNGYYGGDSDYMPGCMICPVDKKEKVVRPHPECEYDLVNPNNPKDKAIRLKPWKNKE